MDIIRTILAAAVVLVILVLLSPGQDGMAYLINGPRPMFSSSRSHCRAYGREAAEVEHQGPLSGCV